MDEATKDDALDSGQETKSGKEDALEHYICEIYPKKNLLQNVFCVLLRVYYVLPTYYVYLAFFSFWKEEYPFCGQLVTIQCYNTKNISALLDTIIRLAYSNSVKLSLNYVLRVEVPNS